MTDILALIAQERELDSAERELYFELHLPSLVNVTTKPVALWPERSGEKPRRRGARWLHPGWIEVEGPIACPDGIAFEARLRDKAWVDVFAVQRSGRARGSFQTLWIKILEDR